ncbi:MAG: 2-hydroxyacid dehydrogenase [Chitinophagales bacterium]|nr:MAG: 2-hydroxyacid dehydrogenase [Chitinophagales bacterium]
MKILITDKIHPIFFDSLRGCGCDLDYLPESNQSDILEIVHQYEGLIINSKSRADRVLIDKAVRLRFIARMGSGMEIIDQEYARQKGIVCINSPEGNCDAVAEYAVGALIALMRNIHSAHAEVKRAIWQREKNRGTELGGKVIGIYGYGHTGSAFARRLNGFGVTVLAYDKYKSGFSDNYIKESSPEEIFLNADVLSLHLPLSEETRYLADYAFFTRFKKNIWVINTARGQHIKTSDLIRAVREGKVVAAALDVLENENLNTLDAQQKAWFDDLVAEQRILLTPHIAGLTQESFRKIAEVLAAKIQKLLPALQK